MANPSVSFNQKQTDPSMSDLLDLHKKEIMLEMNCHAIGTIQSFDKATQTVTATIAYKKSFLKAAPDGSYRPVLVDYPVLIDMPAIVLCGGPAGLTFPIQAGDTCLILFNDRDIDNWFQSGQVAGVASGRLHSFADGIALVGLRSKANPITPYDDTRAVLFWGETMVGVGEEKVLIANAGATLNELLQDLVDKIKDLITQTAAITVTCSAPASPSSVPINAAAITAVSAQIAAVATQIGDLLE